MNLIEKIRAARQVNVHIDGLGFTVRRPTDMEMAKLKTDAVRQGFSDADVLRKYVVDWKGVQEIHLIPGGSPVDVPFEADLFMEWVSDRPDCWTPLVDAILEAYRAHEDKRMESEKKTDVG
jgi:hypothetical protein